MIYSVQCRLRDGAWVRLSLYKYMLLITPHKRHLYYQYKYNSKIEEHVNKQIQAEKKAGQDYLNMAVAFLHPSKAKLGAGGFFMKMYKEELKHMEMFINYQLIRGGTPILCGIDQVVQNENLTLLDAFQQGLQMEKHITQLLEDGVKLAEEVKDYQYAEFITSLFLAEQMEAIHEMANHVTKLSTLGNNEHALYHYDLELAKLYPYSRHIKIPDK